MKRIHIVDCLKKEGEKVDLRGFVDSIRDHGKITFLDLRDNTGIIQCVVENISPVTIESFVAISGSVKERPVNLVNKESQLGEIEISVSEMKVLSLAASPLPIPMNGEASMNKRFDWRFLDLRRDELKKIFKAWGLFEEGFREYFSKNGFTQLYSPSLMSTASESGAEVFKVEYFEKTAYLAQSPQFYKQMAMAAGFEKVFMIGPLFRAEASYTTRHMTEFTGWDFEMESNSYEEIMETLEEVIISGFERLKKETDIKVAVPKPLFPKVTMKEAKEMLAKEGVKSEKDYDVNQEEEEVLCKILKKSSGSDFVFITDWPIEARPFYHMRKDDNPKITCSFDLLFKGLEVVTGAQREHRIDVLETQAKEKKMDQKSISGYLDFFKFGCPPHGGVGMGPARFIMKIFDLPNVKEAVYLPRDVNRLTP